MPGTYKDIQKRTGLSLSTISKYFNGGHLREENRSAIEKAIRDLDFRVNAFARSLKSRRSGAEASGAGKILKKNRRGESPHAAAPAAERRIAAAGRIDCLICEQGGSQADARHPLSAVMNKLPVSGKKGGGRRKAPKLSPAVLSFSVRR